MSRGSWLGVFLAAGALLPPAPVLAAGADFDGASPPGLEAPPAFPFARSPAAGLPVPAAVPADLAAAGAVWNSDAQLARLRAAQPAPKESFSFAVIGDAEPGRFPWERIFAPTEGFRRQVERIQKSDADFMVQLGDIVSKGVDKNYRLLLECLGSLVRIPMLPVIGNHDRSSPNGDGDKSLWRAVFGKTDYWFDYNGWRFVSLDSSDRKLTPAQLAWLDEALSAGLPSVVFTHVPPGYLRGKLVSPEPEEKSYNMSGYFDEGSEGFRRIVSSRGVRRVYLGHIHALGTAEVDGVRYVLTAGGGSPLYPLPPGYPKRKISHYVGVEIGPSGLKETVHELDGPSYPLFP